MHAATSATEINYREDESTSIRYQYLAATVISLSVFCYGSSVGWVSPSLHQLQGDSSPLGDPLTTQEVAAVASLFCVGGLLGSQAAGLLVDRMGRWWVGFLIAVPYAICWALKITATSVPTLYAARVLAGAGGGASLLLAPLYSLEIGSVRVRGALGSIPILALNAGVLFAFVIGAYLSYTAVLWIQLSLPVLFFVSFFFMPETPPYLVKKGKYEKAAKAIAWLRNISIDDAVTQGILCNLKREVLLGSKNSNEGNHENGSNAIPNEEPSTSRAEQNNADQKEISDWKFFVTSKPTLKAFAMCFIIITVQGYVGIFAVVSFVSEIFATAGSTMSPSNAAIVVGSLQLLGSYLSIVLVERLGRKILFITSATTLGIGMGTLGVYFFFKNHGYDMTSVGWIPVTALSIGIFMDATGVGPVPFVIANEVFMVQARGTAMTILSLWIWITQFVQTQFYKDAEDAVGSEGIFLGFSTIAFAGSIFTAIAVPETKGKSLDEILQHFDGRAKNRRNAEHDEENKKTSESVDV